MEAENTHSFAQKAERISAALERAPGGSPAVLLILPPDEDETPAGAQGAESPLTVVASLGDGTDRRSLRALIDQASGDGPPPGLRNFDRMDRDEQRACIARARFRRRGDQIPPEFAAQVRSVQDLAGRWPLPVWTGSDLMAPVIARSLAMRDNDIFLHGRLSRVAARMRQLAKSREGDEPVTDDAACNDAACNDAARMIALRLGERMKNDPDAPGGDPRAMRTLRNALAHPEKYDMEDIADALVQMAGNPQIRAWCAAADAAESPGEAGNEALLDRLAICLDPDGATRYIAAYDIIEDALCWQIIMAAAHARHMSFAAKNAPSIASVLTGEEAYQGDLPGVSETAMAELPNGEIVHAHRTLRRLRDVIAHDIADNSDAAFSRLCDEQIADFTARSATDPVAALAGMIEQIRPLTPETHVAAGLTWINDEHFGRSRKPVDHRWLTELDAEGFFDAVNAITDDTRALSLVPIALNDMAVQAGAKAVTCLARLAGARSGQARHILGGTDPETVHAARQLVAQAGDAMLRDPRFETGQIPEFLFNDLERRIAGGGQARPQQHGDAPARPAASQRHPARGEAGLHRQV